MDVIAGYLKQLRDARVPVLWRPYHEMNGDWFWWGGRSSEHGTKVLYRQLFDRLARHHQLSNLVWIWSVDRPGPDAGPFEDYCPGTNYFDVAALDVYRNDFQQSYYDELLRLAAGKPLALAEVGPPPSVAHAGTRRCPLMASCYHVSHVSDSVSLGRGASARGERAHRVAAAQGRPAALAT